MEKGTISINAQNIMPVIKKWLYSDKDIFVREIVSNACDAISKYKLLVQAGKAPADTYRVDVIADKQAGTLTVSDNGVGMTAEEVKKYIAQVAFSGAEEFLKQYKPEEGDKGGIIGHFGLGFYSAFMVSKKVVIDTKSCEEGAQAVRWTSEDGMAYEIEDSDRAEEGTSVILYLNDEDKEFANMWTVRSVLEKYCAFMPVEIYVSEVVKPEEPKEGEEGEEKKEPKDVAPVLVNDVHPLWMKKPNECTDEEYREFYHNVFHDYDDPLFWIHLNAEFPFNLKGILYFPKLKQDFGTHEGQIKLFSGQVFVADNIKEVIPEFLLLLKGVIDCPDLPLNVSRSFLQNDGYVRKISSYITKKVADKLTELFGGQRATYEGYWNDIAPFIKYGCMKDQKFFDSVKKVLLLKTTAGNYLTFEEYKTRNEAKAAKKVFYTNDAKRQAASVALYTERGIDVAVMDSLIDVNFMSFMEYAGGEDSVTFARVDADVSGLTEDSDEGKDLNAEEYEKLFRKALGKEDLSVKLEALANPDMIAMVTEDEQSRRFKEMSRLYGEKFPMPDQFTLVLNRRNATVRTLAARPEGEVTDLLCKQIYDLARMSAQPLESEEITDFIARSQKLVAMVADEK